MPRPRPATGGTPLLVHMYPSGPGLGTCYPLRPSGPVLIGRDDDCTINVVHPSVSRRHARVEADVDGFYVVDLQSTNGTYINDLPVSRAKLNDGDYLRVGGCIYRFLSGSNIEVAYHEEIYRLTISDGLTGVPNKRHLMEFLERELARSQRYRRPL